MNKSIKYIIVFLILSSMVSCIGVSTKRVMRTTTFMPDKVEMNITLDDFEFVGEQEVSVRYHRYLGMFFFTQEINGKEVAKRNKNTVNLKGRTWMSMDKRMKRAAYDVYIAFPDGDILLPGFIVKEKEQMFLGSKITETMKVKVYKIRK